MHAMRNQLIFLAAAAAALQILLLSASPAFAITAELAKKCRDLAIAATVRLRFVMSALAPKADMAV
jgi:hypothetical protein